MYIYMYVYAIQNSVISGICEYRLMTPWITKSALLAM